MKTILLLLALTMCACAQPYQLGVTYTTSAPMGVCNVRSTMVFVQPTGTLYGCNAGVWASIATPGGGGGGGTVTSVGFSTDLGTAGGTPVTTSGTLTLGITAANIVGKFTGCSGTQYLGADGACHTASSGSVTSISTTSPISGGPITTTGTISCPTCVVSSNTGVWTVSSNDIYNSNSGNVGIGGAPGASYKFDVASGDARFPNAVYVEHSSADGFSGATIFQKRGRTGNANGTPASNSELGWFRADGWNGSAYVGTGLFYFRATEDWTATANGTELQMYSTKNGTSTRALGLRLENDGRVVSGEFASNGTIQSRTGTSNAATDCAFQATDSTGVTQKSCADWNGDYTLRNIYQSGYSEVTNTAAPSNPAAGKIRVYGDSGTGNLTCLTSAGGNCLPGSGTVTTTGSPANGNLTKFSGASSITNGDLSGDVTTSGTLAATVAKVNGVSYGSSPSTHQTPVITASNTATYKTIPDCTDTGGNHLNFTQSTDAFSCGTSGGSGGGLVLVEQHTASASASLNFTTCLSSTYDTYQLTLTNILPATNDVAIVLRFSTDGGSSYDSGTNYRWSQLYDGSSGTTGKNQSNSATGITISNLTPNSSTIGGLGAHVTLYGPGSSTNSVVTGQTETYTGTEFFSLHWGGVHATTSARNAFQILASSGNITSGTVRCYGLAK